MTLRLYKAAEVCEATGLQPYVLRSWEKEFPGIGLQRGPDARVYRESDIEWVRRIKALVFGEGLTLSGARRRLEDSLPRPEPETVPQAHEALESLGGDARARIDIVRSGLRSILDVLSKRVGSAVPELPRNGARRSPVKRAKRTTATKRRTSGRAPGRTAGRKRSSKRKRASA